MRAIPFTQFLRPNGQRRKVFIERPDVIGDKAQALLAAGCRLEIEELSTGDVSMTIEWPRFPNALDENEIPVSHRLCPNGPRVPEMVDELIAEAHERLILKKP